MSLMHKQLLRQVLRNKIFLVLLLLLTILTSLSFFFVRFSIDGNMAVLRTLPSMTENQRLYQNALGSNTSLAYTFLASLTGLTAFVFVMFFYRFFRSNRKQVGCLKALGFRDSSLRSFFVVFTAILALAGALFGLVGGYFLSSVLINANTQTYNVSGLIKSIAPSSLAVGLGLASAVFCIVAFLCYGFVRGKEAGALIAGNSNTQNYGIVLRAANAVSGIIPVKNKFSVRVALRKPVAVLLVFIAVMAFSVCMIMGRSLNISSQKVFDSQTIGHNYKYELRYDYVRFNTGIDEGALPYLEMPGIVSFGSQELDQKVIAIYNEDAMLTLQEGDGQPVALPHSGGVVIGPGLVETYRLRVGDTILISMDGNTVQLKVMAVAFNAKSGSIYMNAEEMAAALGMPPGSHNGDLRNTLSGALPDGVAITTHEQRIEELNRNAVSNNVSAVINQATGALVGCILLFLALYVNLQDNTRDMLILHLMGYRVNAIRKMLVNVYLPIVWVSFLITLAPSIWLAQSIQRSLSITTNDYMPFGTSVWVILLIFILLNMIYILVQSVFSLGIKRIIKKEDITEYTSAE